ncbi:MAG: OmpA family protein [Christensenellaceae bacterium]|jgi:outer membrane protein OmpA-like peptidoglycan-associated protein|nr:OmpA family protein [Christensenellaceae bacterium]
MDGLAVGGVELVKVPPGCIREAKNALSSVQAKDVKNKQIIIVDTGISTTGELNFLDMDFIYGKPEIKDIIAQLKSYERLGILPDLTGIKITFIGTTDGLAEVAEPQKTLTTDKRFIKNLWDGIVRACGSTDVNFEAAAGWDTPNKYTEDADSKFKYVSVINFTHERVIQIPEIPGYDPNNPDGQPDSPNPPNVEVKFPSETVGFKPDRADYLNEANAQKLLRPYADELKKFFQTYPNEKIWIVGTTAAVTKGSTGGIDLSLRRAETVKNTLVSFGIPEDKLLTIGLGSKFPWWVDEFTSGNFDTNVAQANRAVWLLTAHADTDKFNKLKAAATNSELLPEVVERFNSLYH